jgi:hypothetical protein
MVSDAYKHARLIEASEARVEMPAALDSPADTLQQERTWMLTREGVSTTMRTASSGDAVQSLSADASPSRYDGAGRAIHPRLGRGRPGSASERLLRPRFGIRGSTPFSTPCRTIWARRLTWPPYPSRSRRRQWRRTSNGPPRPRGACRLGFDALLFEKTAAKGDHKCAPVPLGGFPVCTWSLPC